MSGNAQPIPFSRPFFGSEEEHAAAAAIRSGWVVGGPRLAEFEGRIAGSGAPRTDHRPEKRKGISVAGGQLPRRLLPGAPEKESRRPDMENHSGADHAQGR